MGTYRVTLEAKVRQGRRLGIFSFEATPPALVYEREGQQVREAVKDALQQFLRTTSLMTGVDLVVRQVERRWESGEGYTPLVTAYRAVPGTEICLWTSHQGKPFFSWVRVVRWEPRGDGMARLVTDNRRNPHGGIYARDDVFETR